jgi:hypothetical protein
MLERAAGTTVEVGEEYLLVLSADFTTGNDLFTLYVNPTPGAAEPASGTIKNDFNIGTINDIFLYATGAFSIDEVRNGSNFADVVPPLPGDFNHDGTVDAADYVVWRKTDGTPADYNIWRANFGQPSGSGSVAGENATILEPTTLVMLIVAAVIVSTRRLCTWRVS